MRLYNWKSTKFKRGDKVVDYTTNDSKVYTVQDSWWNEYTECHCIDVEHNSYEDYFYESSLKHYKPSLIKQFINWIKKL
jgi:hypothetical protein